MDLIEGLTQLAQRDVVYLTVQLDGAEFGSTVVYRGRLRESLSGTWIFNTSVGTNGVAAIRLQPASGTWTVSEMPASGITITGVVQLIAPFSTADTSGALSEMISLTDVIPQDLAD